MKKRGNPVKVSWLPGYGPPPTYSTKLPFYATIKPLGLPEYRVEVYRSNGEIWLRLA